MYHKSEFILKVSEMACNPLHPLPVVMTSPQGRVSFKVVLTSSLTVHYMKDYNMTNFPDAGLRSSVHHCTSDLIPLA